jgi:Putative phage tail protein
VATVGDILADLFGQAGLTAGQYDVSAATDTVTGFVIGQRAEVSRAIEELLRVYTTDLVEVDGKVKAVKRGGGSVVTMPSTDLGAQVWGGREPEPKTKISVKRQPDLELPQRVDLTYFNAPTATNNRNYEQAQAGALRYTKTGTTLEPLTVNTPLVLTEDAARQAAERILYQVWTEREPFVFSLPPKYLYLAPADVLTLPVAGGTARVRLVKVDIGLFGELRCEGVLDSADVLTQTIGGALLPDAVGPVTEAGSTTLVAFCVNALRDADAASVGFYAAANGPSGQDWPGCTLYWSRDGGTTYQELETLSDGATLGTAQSVLADAPMSYDLWDTTNTVDVLITSGTAPQTTSDSDVLGGANAALLGNEVIQFATVTSLGSNVYRLSRLLRGRRGTEQRTATHGTSEQFVLLTDQQVKRINLDSSLVNRTISLKAVTVGKALADATAQTLLVTGAEYTCYAPCQMAGSRDGSSNLTITWKRRTRSGGEWRDYVDVDQPEATLSYDVEIYSGASLVRTFAALTSESCSYTAAQQTTDFGSAQSAIAVKIYQNGKFGRGYGASATV